MDLVTRFLAARRDKLLMKLGCWLVCFSLVLGLMLPQQRAEALVAELTMASVAGVAAAYLCACGLPFVTQGMDKDALVSSVQRLIQEFLDTELGGITIQEWLGNVWDLAVIAGKLIMGRPLTDELVTFAQWVAGKYAAQVGGNAIYQTTESYVTLADGSKFYLCTGYSNNKFLSHGTPVAGSPSSFPVVFSTGFSLESRTVDGGYRLFFLIRLVLRLVILVWLPFLNKRLGGLCMLACIIILFILCIHFWRQIIFLNHFLFLFSILVSLFPVMNLLVLTVKMKILSTSHLA